MVSGFYFFQDIYLLSHETIFFLQKFSHSGAFQFGLYVGFYKPKKELTLESQIIGWVGIIGGEGGAWTL